MDNEFKILVPVFAALIGALIGAWINNGLQTKRIRKEQKAQLLKDLMATRFDSQNDQRAAEAVNFIPVLFAGCQKVLDSHADFHSAVINHQNDRAVCFNNLVVAIAKNIEIDLHPVDLMRTPLFSGQRVLDDNQTRTKLNTTEEV
jgi:hypothetical protein